jgi:hypothetical protein
MSIGRPLSGADEVQLRQVFASCMAATSCGLAGWTTLQAETERIDANTPKAVARREKLRIFGTSCSSGSG